VHTPWPNFLSPEFEAKHQGEVLLFLEIPNFLKTL